MKNQDVDLVDSSTANPSTPQYRHVPRALLKNMSTETVSIKFVFEGMWPEVDMEKRLDETAGGLIPVIL